MANYREAIARPFTDYKKLFVGYLLNLPWPFVSGITGTIAYGYVLNSAKVAYKRRKALPQWKDFWDLFIKGVIAGMITVVYMIPTILITLLVLPRLFMDFFSGFDFFLSEYLSSPGLLLDNYGYLFILLAFAAIATFYLIPLATLNWLIEERFSAAFDFERILKKAFTKKYFVNWLILSLIHVCLMALISVYVFNNGSDEPNAVMIEVTLTKVVLALTISPIIIFARDIFTFTVYGNLFRELKRTKK
ncbi:DUF4013 domain-containing protein [Candidatus Woesearchaeota archaeon]|nr:DUF4013 domain-containing protein [Candidatus Woesearchaeota archaeon]